MEFLAHHIFSQFNVINEQGTIRLVCVSSTDFTLQIKLSAKMQIRGDIVSEGKEKWRMHPPFYF